jgi:hypothetical protein
LLEVLLERLHQFDVQHIEPLVEAGQFEGLDASRDAGAAVKA